MLRIVFGLSRQKSRQRVEMQLLGARWCKHVRQKTRASTRRALPYCSGQLGEAGWAFDEVRDGQGNANLAARLPESRADTRTEGCLIRGRLLGAEMQDHGYKITSGALTPVCHCLVFS